MNCISLTQTIRRLLTNSGLYHHTVTSPSLLDTHIKPINVPINAKPVCVRFAIAATVKHHQNHRIRSVDSSSHPCPAQTVSIIQFDKLTPCCKIKCWVYSTTTQAFWKKNKSNNSLSSFSHGGPPVSFSDHHRLIYLKFFFPMRNFLTPQLLRNT